MMITDRKIDQTYPHTLNVLFHGLWAYELTKDEDGNDVIVVRTPPEEEHRVAAGAWNPTDRDADLIKGATYKFQGIEAGTVSEFDPNTNAIFRGRELQKGAEVQCTIQLPLPKAIQSVRPIVFHEDKPPYTGSDAHLIASRAIAIVQVFTYSANLPQVQLVAQTNGKATGGRRQVGEPVSHTVRVSNPNGGEVANFYLFAQPNGRVHGSHFETAFAKLAALYGLDIVPAPSVAPGPRTPVPEIKGVIWRDLVGLNERAASLGELVPAAGSSGSSCDPFIVDNRRPGTITEEPTTSVQPQAYSKRAQDPSPHKMK